MVLGDRANSGVTSLRRRTLVDLSADVLVLFVDAARGVLRARGDCVAIYVSGGTGCSLCVLVLGMCTDTE